LPLVGRFMMATHVVDHRAQSRGLLIIMYLLSFDSCHLSSAVGQKVETSKTIPARTRQGQVVILAPRTSGDKVRPIRVGVVIAPASHAHAVLAVVAAGADEAARAAIVNVGGSVGADPKAQCERVRAILKAGPVEADRRRIRARIATRPTVLRIGSHVSTSPEAVDSAVDAVIDARSGNTRDVFIRAGRIAHRPTTSAIGDIVFQIGAVIAATHLAVDPAVVPTGSAVGVGLQIAAHPLAGRDRTAGVTAARPSQPAGVPVALFAGVQALALLLGIAAFSEGFARIDLALPGGFQPQGTENCAGKHRPQSPQ